MQLSKTYDPNQYEPTVYAMWETAGAFLPTGEGTPYSIVMPPPNANGNLHMGHALTVAIEDVLARHRRMKGDDVAYIPGADHAGFETWVVYERELVKQGRSRFDFSREQLYSQVWNFVEDQRGSMELQLRALGASASWRDLVFTLDDKVIDTVYNTFSRLWNDGLVYRGERIVNYCTVHQTGFADIEVNYKTEKGKLWHIAYPTLDKIGEIIVATTRPETMLGDTAIAVHPSDERYKHLVGTRVLLPLTDREIPVIADEHVDPEYGTGAVKVTPAHDPNDFEIGERHGLPRIQIIDFDGKLVNTPAQFVGISVQDGRKRVLAALQAAELIRKEEDIEHNVGHCYKCDTVIEPMVKDQWFLRIQPLAERAIQVIDAGEITFTPGSRKKLLLQYLRGLRDWNLSRQIPWGIPIPAFQNTIDPTDWIFDPRVDEETIVVNGTTYRREEDTFDTWFSSGQWPFIVTDYLQEGEMSRFYPTSVMETGTDLLYAWVSRMIMLGLYVTDQVPFRHVYLHGMVLDEKGQKMSKSKGNVVDPMESIGKYGSDALRLGVLASQSPGQNQAFSPARVVAGRNFANKLWNVARFITGKLGEGYKPAPPKPKSLADHWIIRQLTEAAATIDQQMADYRISEASDTMYHTIWGDVADWYVEASKTDDNKPMLAWVLETSLKIAHPFAPFVTETVWQTLWWREGLVMKEAWPGTMEYSESAADTFEQLQAFITEVRLVSAEIPARGGHVLLNKNDNLIADNSDLIKHMARLKEIEAVDDSRGLRLATPGRSAWLDIDEKAVGKYREQLETRLDTARQRVQSLKGRLENETYTSKAPASLVEESRQQLKEQEALVERLAGELSIIQ